MIKNYESYKPSDIARFLKTELFAIEIDKLAGMQLRDDYEHVPDILRGEIVSDLSKKESVMTTIYGLVKLYENGNTIRVLNSDDIVNIYSLIYTHFRNIDNLTSGSIHPIKVDTEGLRILAMLAEEVFENNKINETLEEIKILKSIKIEKKGLLEKVLKFEYDLYGKLNDYEMQNNILKEIKKYDPTFKK